MAESCRLVRPFRLRDAFIHRLASGEAFADAVPVGNRLFTQLPAEQDDLAVHFAREIEQADIEVFHLYTDGVDLAHGIFNALQRLVALSLARSQMNDVQRHAAAKEYLV